MLIVKTQKNTSILLIAIFSNHNIYNESFEIY